MRHFATHLIVLEITYTKIFFTVANLMAFFAGAHGAVSSEESSCKRHCADFDFDRIDDCLTVCKSAGPLAVGACVKTHWQQALKKGTGDSFDLFKCARKLRFMDEVPTTQERLDRAVAVVGELPVLGEFSHPVRWAIAALDDLVGGAFDVSSELVAANRRAFGSKIDDGCFNVTGPVFGPISIGANVPWSLGQGIVFHTRVHCNEYGELTHPEGPKDKRTPVGVVRATRYSCAWPLDPGMAVATESDCYPVGHGEAIGGNCLLSAAHVLEKAALVRIRRGNSTDITARGGSGAPFFRPKEGSKRSTQADIGFIGDCFHYMVDPYYLPNTVEGEMRTYAVEESFGILQTVKVVIRKSGEPRIYHATSNERFVSGVSGSVVVSSTLISSRKAYFVVTGVRAGRLVLLLLSTEYEDEIEFYGDGEWNPPPRSCEEHTISPVNVPCSDRYHAVLTERRCARYLPPDSIDRLEPLRKPEMRG